MVPGKIIELVLDDNRSFEYRNAYNISIVDGVLTFNYSNSDDRPDGVVCIDMHKLLFITIEDL